MVEKIHFPLLTLHKIYIKGADNLLLFTKLWTHFFLEMGKNRIWRSKNIRPIWTKSRKFFALLNLNICSFWWNQFFTIPILANLNFEMYCDPRQRKLIFIELKICFYRFCKNNVWFMFVPLFLLRSSLIDYL